MTVTAVQYKKAILYRWVQYNFFLVLYPPAAASKAILVSG